MSATATCATCGTAGELYRRPDGTFGCRCLCDPSPRVPPASATAVRHPVCPPTATAAPRPRAPTSSDLPFRATARIVAGDLVLWLPRVPRAVEGPNGRCWQTKAKAARAWRQLVGDALLETLPQPWPAWSQVEEIRYQVHRGPGDRVHDRDNLVVALGKPIADELVSRGIFPGDGPDVVLSTPDIAQIVSDLPWGFVVVRVRPVRRARRQQA